VQPLPADVDALLALYNGRRYAEAENMTRVLLGQYPDFGFGWKLLGGTLQMQGKDALSAFQKVAELMPDDPEAHYNLGIVLKNSGRLDAAAASYRRAVQLEAAFAAAANGQKLPADWRPDIQTDSVPSKELDAVNVSGSN
jgi:tetratricopeptide (TPR) repeat protein